MIVCGEECVCVIVCEECVCDCVWGQMYVIMCGVGVCVLSHGRAVYLMDRGFRTITCYLLGLASVLRQLICIYLTIV